MTFSFIVIMTKGRDNPQQKQKTNKKIKRC